MLNIDELNKLGVDTENGLKKCLGKEDLYLKFVGMALADGNFDKLEAAITAGDLAAGFEAAHALKGVLANLSLDNILKPVSDMTEDLRAGKDLDYSNLLAKVKEERSKLLALSE